MKAEAVEEARGLLEVTPPRLDGDQLWKQPSAARLWPSLQPGPSGPLSPLPLWGRHEQMFL